jgi:hypothetical protein
MSEIMFNNILIGMFMWRKILYKEVNYAVGL